MGAFFARGKRHVSREKPHIFREKPHIFRKKPHNFELQTAHLAEKWDVLQRFAEVLTHKRSAV